MNMRRLLLVLLLTAHAAAAPLFSQEMEDVVYLKDGNTVRGIVIDRILGESVKIRAQDGSVRVYAMDEIARIVKEPVEVTGEVESQGDAPTPGVEESPTLGDEEAPTPQVEEAPAPEVEKAPAPETEEGPAPEAEGGPAPEDEPGPTRRPGSATLGSTHKNPWLAFGLSALIPGTGQFYNEQPRKGLPQLGAAIAGSALVFFAARDNYEDIYGYWVDPDNDDRRAVYGGVLWLGGLLWSAIDAPVSANRINRKGQEGSGDQGLTLHLHPVLWRNAPGVRLVMRY